MTNDPANTFSVEQLVDGNLYKQRLSAIYKSNNLYDVTLISDKEKFSAHKVILSLFSDVFFNFLKNKYWTEPIIIRTNVRPKLIRQILMYMYEGNVSDLSEGELLKFLDIAQKLKIHGITIPAKSDAPNLVLFKYLKQSTGQEEANCNEEKLITKSDSGGCDYSSPNHDTYISGSSNALKDSVSSGALNKKKASENNPSLNNKSHVKTKTDLVQNKDN